MKVDIFTSSKRNPVRVKDGFGWFNVTNHPLGSLFTESQVCQASLVVLHIPNIDATTARNVSYSLASLIAVDNGSILMYKHDREREIIPKEVEIAEYFFTYFCMVHDVAPFQFKSAQCSILHSNSFMYT
jgi:hypothetical protein